MTHYVLPDTSARVEYDKSAKGFYLYVDGLIADGAVDRTVMVNESPLVHLDYDESGNLVGIEVLLHG